MGAKAGRSRLVGRRSVRPLASRDVECDHVAIKLQQNCALFHRYTDHHSPWQSRSYRTLEQGKRSILDRDHSPPLHQLVPPFSQFFSPSDRFIFLEQALGVLSRLTRPIDPRAMLGQA